MWLAYADMPQLSPRRSRPLLGGGFFIKLSTLIFGCGALLYRQTVVALLIKLTNMFWNSNDEKDKKYFLEKCNPGQKYSLWHVKMGEVIDKKREVIYSSIRYENDLVDIKGYKLYSDGELVEVESENVSSCKGYLEKEAKRKNKQIIEDALSKLEKLEEKVNTEGEPDLDISDWNTAICNKCNKFFDSERGLAIHNGKMHE